MAKKTSNRPVSNDKKPSTTVEDAVVIEETSAEAPKGESLEEVKSPAELAEQAVVELSEEVNSSENSLDTGTSPESAVEPTAEAFGDLPVNDGDEPKPEDALSGDKPEDDGILAADADKPKEDDLAEDMVRPESERDATEGAAPAPVAPPTVIHKKSGGIGGVIGGVVAAALGFGVAQVVPDGWPVDLGTDELKAQIAAQDSTISDLQGQLEVLQGGLASFASAEDLAGLEEKTRNDLAGALTTLEQSDEGLSSQLADNIARIEALERRPINESTDEAVAAAVQTYNDEVAALRAEIASQLDETKALMNNTAEKEREAELAAKRAAEARALLAVQAGIETGEDYSEALAAIESVDVPAVLGELAGNVPTLAQLTEALPGLAREALEASRAAQEGDSAGDRLGTFFQRQLGVRSLAPKEGDSADAVLSRIEAAARSGDLMTAIQEADGLPEPAMAVLSDWIAQAETRQTALKAADDLAQSLTSN